jgi:predicted extracellular nuclease
MKTFPIKETINIICYFLLVQTALLSTLTFSQDVEDDERQVVIADTPNRTITLISTIQGFGTVSPLVGETVTVEAVVVGDFQVDGNTNNNSARQGTIQRNLFGFFLQEEDSDSDDDPQTSEGIFVNIESGITSLDVSIGNIVQVTGLVEEYFGETRLMGISAVRIIGTATVLPTPAYISLPSPAIAVDGNGKYVPDLERYEGMRVFFPGTLTINEQRNLERFNEVTLIQGGRPVQFTQKNYPDPLAYEESLVAVGNRQIIYDDGLNQQNIGMNNLDGFGPTYNTKTAKRMGDTIRGLSGILSYQWAGNAASGATWRVRSAIDGENTFTPSINPRPLSSPLTVVGGSEYTLVSANLMNYFVTLDTDGSLTANGMQPRGANTFQELGRQTTKVVSALLALDADIFGFTEVENDFDDDSVGNALKFLVSVLNGALGGEVYDWVNPGRQYVDSSDAISTAFMYKTSSFVIEENTTVAILNDATIGSLGLNFGNAVFDGSGTNRAGLATTFSAVDGSGCVTIALNHFKSKGSPSDVPGNQDKGDGVGNNNALRLQAAESVVAWLESNPTGSDCPSKVIMGDLNSYAKEDPINYIVESGYSNLEEAFMDDEAYSFLFDGAVGTLDYVLANDAFFDVIDDVRTPHYNSDETDAIDYNSEYGRDLSIFDQDVPYRFADHDPVVVGFSFMSKDSENTTVSPTSTPTSLPESSTISPTVLESEVATNMTTVITLISQIQGPGKESPLVGKNVTVEAVVIADFQDGDEDTTRNLGGFFLQEEDGDADNDPNTSEGIFVLEEKGQLTDVEIGDLVQVSGIVQEFYGETRIVLVSAITIVRSGSPLPTPATITLPARNVVEDRNGALVPDLEAYEGMLVKFNETLTINSQDNLDRFNEIGLIQGDLPFHFTQKNRPGVDEYEEYRRNIGARRIVYDDGTNEQNVAIAYLDGFGPMYDTDNAKRIGDMTQALNGVLCYQWAGATSSDSTWRVRSAKSGVNKFQSSSNNERPPVKVPVLVESSLKIVSLNTFDYFVTLDDGESTTAIGKKPSGANNQEEFDRQTQKLVTTLVSLDADIVGLLAVENDFSEDESGGNALNYLISALNQAIGENSYDWVRPGNRFVDSSDASSSAFIFKKNSFSIEPGSQPVILNDSGLKELGLDFDNPVFDGENTNQAALASTFLSRDGACITLALNNWKFDDSVAAGDGNEDQRDGAGMNNGIRLQAAKGVDVWLNSNPTGSNCSLKGIIGSLNSYAKETPVTYLEGQRYFNVDAIFTGEDVYNSVRGGRLGTLDYALVNEELFFSISDATTLHYCSNEASAIDYHTDFGRNPTIFDGSVPYRYSNTDPVIFFLKDRQNQLTVEVPTISIRDPTAANDGDADADDSAANMSHPWLFSAIVAVAMVNMLL